MKADRHVFRKTPYGIWAFGAFFLFTSLPFVLGPLGLFTDLDQIPWWARVLCVLVGSIGVGAGVYFILDNPGTTIRFRHAPEALEIHRQWLFKQRQWHVLKGDIVSVDLDETKRGEDKDVPMWRVHLTSLRDGRVDLSVRWSRNKAKQESLRGAVREYANLSG